MHRMDTPLVSLIIPYYKGERYIAALLDSVLSSGCEGLEIVVVNDGSPKETLAPLAAYADRIRVIEQENRGQAAARNRGLSEARGDIIAFLDQDDFWPPGRMAVLMPLLGDHDFARGMTQEVRMHADGSVERAAPAFRPELIGAALYRRSVFAAVGGFDETMRVGEDFDWNIRLAEAGLREARVADVTLCRRRHDANQSDAPDFIQDGQFMSLRKKLGRARTASI